MNSVCWVKTAWKLSLLVTLHYCVYYNLSIKIIRVTDQVWSRIRIMQNKYYIKYYI